METKKFIEKLKSMEPIFLGDWSESKLNGLISDFEGLYSINDISIDLINKYNKDIHIVFAYYGYENYSGDSYVLFIKDSKLFEVFGGHCSCYGLEGQFEPEEVFLEVLQNRLTNNYFDYHDYKSGFEQLIKKATTI